MNKININSYQYLEYAMQTTSTSILTIAVCSMKSLKYNIKNQF